MNAELTMYAIQELGLPKSPTHPINSIINNNPINSTMDTTPTRILLYLYNRHHAHANPAPNPRHPLPLLSIDIQPAQDPLLGPLGARRGRT